MKQRPYKICKPTRKLFKILRIKIIKSLKLKDKKIDKFINKFKIFYKQNGFIPSVKVTVSDTLRFEVDLDSQGCNQFLTLHFIVLGSDLGIFPMAI